METNPASTTLRFIDYHNSKKGDGQRLGQRFFNEVVETGPWPALFYSTDNAKVALDIFLFLNERDKEFLNGIMKKLDRERI